jgi:hypothetical protein
MARYQTKYEADQIAIIDTFRDNKIVATKALPSMAAIACAKLNNEYQAALSRYPLKASKRQLVNS